MPVLVAVTDEDEDDGVELEITCDRCGRVIVWRLGDAYPECTCDGPEAEDA